MSTTNQREDHRKDKGNQTGHAVDNIIGLFQRPYLTTLLLALLFVFSLNRPRMAQAQTPASDLDQLTVDIWPDYDREAVLILLTGTLPESSALPAVVTLPIPAGANLNAVARIDQSGAMMADIDYDDSSNDQLTLTTPDPTFRVEYYVPYTVDGDQHAFTFDWRSPMTVDALLTTVQQPALAVNMNVEPAAEITTGGDGLQYHNLEPQQVPAGANYTVASTYSLSSPQLTADFLAEQQTPVLGALETDPRPETSADSGLNWILIGGIVGAILLIAATAWLAMSRRPSRRVVKPRPVRRTSPSPPPPSPRSAGGANFCHECGLALDSSDRFCRNCGTAVKGT